MFLPLSNVPAVLDGRYRQLLRRLPTGIRYSMNRSAATWICGCGHSHRYEPSLTDPATTLTVTCPGCRRTATLRAAGRPANRILDAQVVLGGLGSRIGFAGHRSPGAARS